ILVETEIKPLSKIDKKVGIDLGIKDFAILSTGEKIPNPKYLRKYEKQLIRWQRIMSRRKQGGSNWNKARLKVAKIHEKIMNCRNDFRSEEHTSELQSRENLVCRLLLEKKK